MKIDFYILENLSAQQSWQYTCQLIEKIHDEQHAIYINAHSHEEAAHLDQLLWTYREDSFLPHNIYNDNDDFPPLIQIGHSITPTRHKTTLINLAHEIPIFSQQFENIVEIVFPGPHMQQLARDRYRQYRDRGDSLATHKIKELI